MMAKAQNSIEITVGGRSMTATLADTEAARRLKEKLESAPVTVRMDDYGGFEKVGDLPWSLPTSNSQITTSPGDIMLYQGRSIVIFYGSNSWAYTPLGKIDGADASGIRDFLAGSSVDVTLSLKEDSGIAAATADPDSEPEIFTPPGHPNPSQGAPPLRPPRRNLYNQRKETTDKIIMITAADSADS